MARLISWHRPSVEGPALAMGLHWTVCLTGLGWKCLRKSSKIVSACFCHTVAQAIRHNHASLLWSAIPCCPCRDVCALSMLFILPGFISGMQDAPLPFVVLDEPESCLNCLELMSVNVWWFTDSIVVMYPWNIQTDRWWTSDGCSGILCVLRFHPKGFAPRQASCKCTAALFAETRRSKAVPVAKSAS